MKKHRETDKDLDLQEVSVHKGKKKKKPTECSAKIGQFGHCRLCGSDNIVYERLNYCTVCKKEEVEITAESWWMFSRTKPLCKCKANEKYPSFGPEISLANCVDCGAGKGPLCPNCKQHMWYKFDKCGHRFACQCGFRKEIPK